MDLKQLRYFIAVAEEGSFTAAAEKLHITQPPLSRQIQLLEERLQVTLIERSARPICLTQAGKLFYEQTSQLLHRLQQIEEATTKLGKSEQSTLRIGFVASTLYGGLPILVRKFRKAYPQVKLQFSELTSLEQIQALKSGRIDIGIGRVRVYDAAIARVVLREEPLALAYSTHTNVGKTLTDSVSIKKLHNQVVIVYPSEPRPSFADQVLNELNDQRICPAEVLEVRSLQTALGLVAAGEGLCLIPHLAKVRDDIQYAMLTNSELTSPIIFSHRLNDSSWYIPAMFDLLKKMYKTHAGYLGTQNIKLEF